jgi:hypothetical protein
MNFLCDYVKKGHNPNIRHLAHAHYRGAAVGDDYCHLLMEKNDECSLGGLPRETHHEDLSMVWMLP